MPIADRVIDAFAKKVADLPDKPNQSGMTAAQVKAQFDAAPEELRQALNGLIQDLVAEYYDGVAIDAKINAATKTITFEAGDTFPQGPYNNGQAFYKSDEKVLYNYDTETQSWVPAGGSKFLASLISF